MLESQREVQNRSWIFKGEVHAEGTNLGVFKIQVLFKPQMEVIIYPVSKTKEEKSKNWAQICQHL